jgi:hypothetical protein
MKIKFGHIFIGCILFGFGSVIVLQSRANALLREAQRRLRMQAGELTHEQIPPAQNEAAAVAAGELEKLHHDYDEVAHLRTNIEVMRAALAKNSPPETAEKRAEPWRNAGRSTPDDTLHSVVWAAMNGEVDALMPMLAFEPENQAQADALFASLPEETRVQFDNARKLIATMISGRMPTNLKRANVIDETVESSDVVAVKFNLKQGSEKAREATFRFQRSGPEWQLIVPTSVMADYRQSLTNR